VIHVIEVCSNDAHRCGERLAAASRQPVSGEYTEKAQERRLVEIFVHDLREYAHDKHRTIDDAPYGGGPE